MLNLTVYLAGQIHDDWRDELAQKAKQQDLPLTFVGPQTNHDRSDNIGEDILGEQPNNYYRDNAASDINNLRTQVLMNKALLSLYLEKSINNGIQQWMRLLRLL